MLLIIHGVAKAMGYEFITSGGIENGEIIYTAVEKV